MISSGVIANAVINLVGNFGGFRGQMREAQTQLWGLMTLANRAGGVLQQSVFSPFFAWRGMKRIDDAQQAAALQYDSLMGIWKSNRPTRPIKGPGVTAAQHAQAMQQYRIDMETWRSTKPDKKQVFDTFVHGAALAESKLLLAGVAFSALSQVMVSAISYASDFTEQLNKMVGLFGKSSDVIMNHVGNLSRWGIGKSEYMANLSNLGVELMGAGIPEKTTARMASEMGQRAIDVASWYNIADTDRAFQKFVSGLAGMGRPLKELGVIINEERVQIYALTHGLWDGRSALTESIKVQARYGLIMQETARAVGDYERTYGAFANQLRAFQGNWSNFMAALGKALEPVATGILRIVNLGLSLATTSSQYLADFRDKYLFSSGVDEEARKRDISRQNRMAMDRQYADEVIADAKMSERGGGRASHTSLEGFAKRLQEGVFNDSGRMLVDLTRTLIGLSQEQIIELRKINPQIKAFTEQNAPNGAWN